MSADTDKRNLNQPHGARHSIEPLESLDIDAERVDHLLIVKAFADDLDLVGTVNRLAPTQMEVKPGLIVLGLVLDTLTGRSPLYRLVEFFEGRDTGLLLGESVSANVFTDDTVGRVLDLLFQTSNQLTRKYIYGKGLLALATPTARFCYHFNPTGSTIAITDMAQAVVNAYTYEPFGLILAEQETFPQPFKFVGRFGVMAEPNGLYYMRARYYDPSVGRFTSEDPIGFAGGDFNLSAYVENNPVNKVDPEGLQAVPAPFPAPFPLPPVFIPGTPENRQFVKDFLRLFKREPVPEPNPGNSIPDELTESWPAADDWRGQCIRLYALCKNQGWSGRCGDCLNKCTAQHEWPFENCAPKRGCK